MMLKVELPLDPGVMRVIAAVQSGAKAQGLDPLLLVHVFGQRVRRATKDVDFAVALANWEAFEQLKERLIQEHGFAAKHLGSRLMRPPHRSAASRHRCHGAHSSWRLMPDPANPATPHARPPAALPDG